ncbi:MAG: hypothetical protein IPG96_18420 [Proteobacteria bacterium]|nr:hypothetical protein [Pseudomonadota bacterium]
MAARKRQPFECPVVHETVQIQLRTRHPGRFSGADHPYVQCDQRDCQHVDSNVPPCPLSLTMFAEELAEREAQARLRQQNRDES